MRYSYLIYTLCIGLTLSSILSGCLPFVIGGAATNTIKIAGSDRSLSGIKNDIAIWTNIKNQYIQYNSKDLFQRVNVRVMDQRVMLTGSVKDPNTKHLAEKIAWIPYGVHEVINEIIEEDVIKNIKILAMDKAIMTSIKARLAFEDGVKSGNYKIDSVAGTVYVIGATKSATELDCALELISKVAGVKKVVNYVIVK